MNNKEIINQLIDRANQLDAQGLHREADVIHEHIRVANPNQSDKWNNFGQNLGEAALWTNPITRPIKSFQAIKNWADPMFAGLHDNTGAFQDELSQFATEVQNSNISSLFKQAIVTQINQAMQNAKNMNPDYFKQNHSDWAQPETPVTPSANQPAVNQVGQEELLRRFGPKTASSLKFRRVEAQEQIDNAKSLLAKLIAIRDKFAGNKADQGAGGIIQTNTPGFLDTVKQVDNIIQTLSVLAEQEKNSSSSPQAQNTSGADFIHQVQIAQSDPVVQEALKAYMYYGVKFGQDKMFASLEANAQGHDISVFKTLLKDSWKPEYQKAYNNSLPPTQIVSPTQVAPPQSNPISPQRVFPI